MQIRLARQASVSLAGRAPLPLASRDAALLAWLALEGPTARTRLATLLWPDSPAEAARNTLRQRLFQLKRQCGELVSGQAVLALAPEVTHDLDSADGLMDDSAPFEAAEFAQWLAAQRERLRSRARQHLAARADAAEQAQDWPAALGLARELLALDILSEGAHRRVMRLHYLAGDRAAALLAFDQCERVLKHEVGATPSDETLALLATLEQADAGAALTAPGRVPASVQRPPRLIGRDAETSALQQAWQQGRRVIVGGDGGLGKTRLVGDFAAACGGVLMASARPGDARVAYASASRLLRALPLAALNALPASLRGELARLLPELGPAAPAADDEQRTRLYNAVVAAFDHRALGLTGVAFDDLHFADAASAELLQYTAGATRCRWIVTARLAELEGAAASWLADWRGQPDTRLLELQPLALAQIEELVDSLAIPGLAGARSAPALLRHTGGNPLFLLETIKAWLMQAGEPSVVVPMRLPAVAHVGALIERRIGQLSTQAVLLARCAAVAASDFSIELASRVLGLRTLELADPWAELEAAQVLNDGAFVHDLIYESALASVPRPVARRLHAEVAEFLSEQDGEPARLAGHWALAERWPAAASAYAAAAQRALEAGRSAEACNWLAQAADAHGRAGQADARFETLHRRAMLLAGRELGAEAQTAADALRAAARNDPQRLSALQVRIELAMHRQEVDVVLALAPEAVATAHALAQPQVALRLALAWSGTLLDARRAKEAWQVLQPHADAAAGAATEAELRWEYPMARALTLDHLGRLREAAAEFGLAEGLARQSARPDWLWQAMANGAGVLGRLGRAQACCERLGSALALARERELAGPLRLMQSEGSLAHRLRDCGRYGEALCLFEQHLAAFEVAGMQGDAATLESRIALLALWLGQPARAQAVLNARRDEVPLGIGLFRRVMQAEVAATLGGDAAPAMQAALAALPGGDDAFSRVITLFLARHLPPDEGEAMAAGLAHWATRQERYGLALSAHVRAATCAAAQRAWARALVHVEAVAAFEADVAPDNLYPAESWLVAAQVHAGFGRLSAAAEAVQAGCAWVRARHDHDVPEAFRESFLQRNPVNRELLLWAARIA